MSQPLTMSPDLVYSLVASNPNLKNIVEQTARLAQIQQQMGPMLQQMATNPMAAANGFVNWQAQMQAQQQAQQQTAPEPPAQQVQQNQQGGQTVGPFEQAMAIVDEFRKNFVAMNNNLKEIHDICTANTDAIKALQEREAAPVKRSVAADK